MTRVDLFSSLTHIHDNDDMIQTARPAMKTGDGGITKPGRSEWSRVE